MFPNNQEAQGDTRNKKQFPNQYSRPEAFTIAWDVPQENKRKEEQLTGKVGEQVNKNIVKIFEFIFAQADSNSYQQQQFKELQQENKTIKQKDLNSNIFNVNPNQVNDAQQNKGYGDFYQVDRKKKVREEERNQGYGHFYQKNEQGGYQNIPKPAESMKYKQQ